MQQTPGTVHRPLPRPVLRVLLTMLVCLGLWLVLSAPSLERAAEAAPDGARRTAALTILRPVAWLSEASGLSSATDAVEEALGRDPDSQPGGEIDVEDAIEAADLPRLPREERAPDPPPRRDIRGAGRPAEPPQEKRKDSNLRKPSGRYKLRIAVVGDSLADGIGDGIQRVTNPSLTHVLNVGRVATGLARADYFDWVANMEKIRKRYTPDVVVVLIGGNDKQSVVFPGGRAVISGDPSWGAAYRDRVEDFLAAAGSKTHVVWVGLPPVKERGKSEMFENYNEIYSRAVKDRLNAAYVDIWDMFSDDRGRYKPYGRGPGGDVTLLRAGDGSHFTPTGYEMIATAITDALRSEWNLDRRVLD